tara:strand:+ start:1293 stop:1508 length:216 start_codon:yes stop_codon:yes gene_type:complete
MLSKACIKHLNDAKMTRWQHCIHAIIIAWRLQKAVLAIIIHAFIPRLFTTYASEEMQNILNAQDKIMEKDK